METVYLPWEEAVALEVKQNLDRDQRIGLISQILTEEEKQVYKDEAIYVLATFEEGFQPDFPDHVLVKVKKDEECQA